MNETMNTPNADTRLDIHALLATGRLKKVIEEELSKLHTFGGNNPDPRLNSDLGIDILLDILHKHLKPAVDLSKYKLVKIGWADAIENLDGWHTEEEALKWAADDDWIVHQVGWVLKETNDYILLSNKYNEASGGRDSTYGGLFKIPKPWIKYCIDVKPCI